MGDSPIQRVTKQRLAILDVIRESDGPLTVDEIHEHAGKRCDGLGIATVYRNVKMMQEKDEIQTVFLPDGEVRYEAADLGHHHHFRCRVCERVFDLDICPVSLPDGSVLPGGFEVEDHEVILYGRCPGCAG